MLITLMCWLSVLLEKGISKKLKVFCKTSNQKGAAREDWTLDRWFTRPALCHWAMAACSTTVTNSLKTN